MDYNKIIPAHAPTNIHHTGCTFLTKFNAMVAMTMAISQTFVTDACAITHALTKTKLTVMGLSVISNLARKGWSLNLFLILCL